ncbi:phosphate ABC transporter permease [Alcaligenes faecalis subsp. faecalis NCIB 8687]|uniref:Phosphate transport system permease protein n=1 Tax=Alcaligenes faecalis TaxID=511 RepID=Q6WB53_ALCFA|nr:phosphate permease [Alcaligenes faecalis subsp. faecalis NCIB 8687]EJC61968.1 phosphate ABC transporter permease [Alcaligenes faecalis subsp. faecalis NCIB 8687]
MTLVSGEKNIQRFMPSAAYLARRRFIDKLSRFALMAAAALSVFITLGIVYVLVSESWGFFEKVSLWTFLTDTQWTPMFENPQFGVWPLLTATLWAAGIALIIAIPLGTVLAVYLSEFARPAVRESIKPCLELLEAVPTIVYGYFALLLLTPFMQNFVPGLGGFNLLVPGIVLGIMILPYIVSVSEDAMRAVPGSLREGAYALGMSRIQTAVRVIIPGAFSGITAAYVLGMSRAVGETMVLAVAAGQNPNLTMDPREGAATITAYIVQMSMGDLPHGSLAYQSIFAVGLVLFLITLAFNVIGYQMRKRYREVY